MEKVQIGLQLHSVREDFAENPEMTLQKVAEMGYQGVELVYSALTREAEYYTQILEQSGLACYSVMMDWKELQPGESFESPEGIPQRELIQGIILKFFHIIAF